MERVWRVGDVGVGEPEIVWRDFVGGERSGDGLVEGPEFAGPATLESGRRQRGEWMSRGASNIGCATKLCCGLGGDLGGVVGAVVIHYRYGELAGVILLEERADGDGYGWGFVSGGDYGLNFGECCRERKSCSFVVEMAQEPELAAEEEEVEPDAGGAGG